MASIPWTARVLTLFPDMFPGPLGHSLAGEALSRSHWSLETIDIRAYAKDPHRTVDAPPFGGGAGMVLRPDVLDAAISAARAASPALPLIYLTPRGVPFTQKTAHDLAGGAGGILLCGRYEGVDERVLAVHRPIEISLGDFVLSGGEPAAVAIIDACVRLLPGVVGTSQSIEEESFEHDLLEHPHYTRPREWHGLGVPEVLLSGHHVNVKNWRKAESERLTRERRPDLYGRYINKKSMRAACPTCSNDARKQHVL